jgi:hypothetical protein
MIVPPPRQQYGPAIPVTLKIVQPPIQNNERDTFQLAVNNYVAGRDGLFDTASAAACNADGYQTLS